MSWIENPTETKGCNRLLEVIVCSLEDALEAERGGADRLELVRELDRGGLTPPIDVVRCIKDCVRIPLRVMLRESEREERPSHGVVHRLSNTLSELAKIGVDGVVVGYLRGGEVDTETMIEVLSVSPKTPATFHHAFDSARNPVTALRALQQMRQIDRVLTRGGPGNGLERASLLNHYCDVAGNRPRILVGGDVTQHSLHELSVRTKVHEFHVGRAARDPRTGRVSASAVRQLKETLNQTASARDNADAERIEV